MTDAERLERDVADLKDAVLQITILARQGSSAGYAASTAQDGALRRLQQLVARLFHDGY